MLSIKNLHATVHGKEILRGLNLEIAAGEVHAVMGPNGSGKSTLSYVLSGREGYEVTDGEISYNGKNLLELDIHERAGEGIFLAFQYPVEIPGVSSMNFLRTALNSTRRYRDMEEISAVEFLKLVREKAKALEMDEKLLQRPVNVGFSGGEKKRNEILQMSLLEPTLAVLDETDSGLDIDALKVVADGVNALRAPNRSSLVITHYQRLLSYIVPDFVHVLANGKIAASGDKELALELEKNGYAMLGLEDTAAA
ncbi:MAG: Fe-S cluster assembly ATPase SufC [Rhodospirillaceae bacterium]|nr:Fe-S cluster assembly ATPase SufC [Rhodospirillaceae bacterium]|tara:strand:+ start:16714 stop:17472 length:759 start_codon:yes stop_codon:yes gene_type:complete